MARSAWRSLAYCSATFTRPASGETMTRSSPSSRMASVSTGRAWRWSTGPSKKPWIWPRVEVDRHEAGRAGGGEHVGDQLGGDGLAALGLAVLAGVAVEGADGGDALGRGPASRVDHDQLLHHGVVDRHALGVAVALDDEDVGAADVLAQLGVDLAVGELGQVGFAERLVEDRRRSPAASGRCARPDRRCSFFLVTSSMGNGSGDRWAGRSVAAGRETRRWGQHSEGRW